MKLLKNRFIEVLIAVSAVILVADSANAQQRPNNQNQNNAASPWYERFTAGSETDTGVNSWVPRSEPKANIRISPRSRWGVSFGMQEQPQRPTDNRNGQVSAGAFYDVSPKIRIGTAVVLPDGSVSVGKNGLTTSEQQLRNPRTAPSVKVESAFRF